MKSRTLLLACAASLVLPASLLQAVQYGPQIFDRPDGATDLGDGTTIASNNGTASVQGGALLLTSDETTDTHASFRIPAQAASAQGWTASFEFVMADAPGGDDPGDGLSFSYGAIPAFNAGQGDPAAPDAHGQGEEGWGAGVEHLSFEIDAWRNDDLEQGLNIAHNGTDLAFDNRRILNNGQTLTGSVWMSWHPSNGASMSIDLGPGLTPVFANIATPGFTADNAHLFAISARTGGATIRVEVDNVQVTTIPPGFVVLPSPIISEFMAENKTVLEDEDCRTSDWLELFNSTAGPINLNGWYLTDDPADPTKWQIPDLPLAANERAVIFASNKDQTTGELHTDFRLNKDGGYLALIRPDGVTIASSYNYPPQQEDISYGTLGQAQTEGEFINPTPGDLNVGPQGNLILEKVIFSLENQVISETASLELSSPIEGATIKYTTNATAANPTWLTYSTPIVITNTTRVTAYLEQARKSDGPVRDRTFVRLGPTMANVRSELPIIIVDSFQRNLDAESSANSQNPKRPVHGIFIDIDPVSGRATPTDLPNFQGRAGMRVRGQTSAGFPKKQYSFETWDSEGNDKNVNIFGYPAESDWVIHAPYSDKTLMRNKIVYETHRELGYPSSRTRFCELYFNSSGGDVGTEDYRGVYVFMEKIKRNDDRVNIKQLENCDTARNLTTGGYIFKKDKGQGVDITFSTAKEFHSMAFVEPDQPNAQQRAYLDSHVDRFEGVLHDPRIFASPQRGYASYINVRSFIDTHIWVEVYKNIDGYRLSSYFTKDRGRKIVAGPVWDYNLSLGNADYLNGYLPQGWYYSQLGTDAYPWYGRLFQDPEFVVQYWDRWFELREGMLGTDAMMERIDGHSRLISRAAGRNFQKWRVLGTYLWPNAPGVAQRRRYGDEVNWMKDWLTDRMDWIDSQHSMPPVFSQDGGVIGAGATLTITDPNPAGGQIYYTTDGSDPRLPGNTASVSLLPAESQCRYLVPTGPIADWNTVDGPADLANWDTGPSALGYETTPGSYATLINTPLPAGTTSAYARFEFEIGHQDTIDAYGALNLLMQYDDGFVAYLNGVEVANINAPASPQWNSVATDTREGEDALPAQSVSLTTFKDQLRIGTNVLAIQMLNTGGSSEGLLCNPRITASSNDDAPSSAARLYTGAITLNGSQTVRARVKQAAGWTPIQNEAYAVGGEPAGTDNLVVSEINYRPGPATTEASRGFDSRADFEFIEVMNISQADVDLTGVRFTGGVEFNFALGDVRYLAPGERLVVVSNRDAFELRYANLLSAIRIAGEYTQNLSNDGETIILSDAAGEDIKNFTYNDKNPWPEAPDGDGLSLVLRNPRSNPDHNDPLNWRSNTVTNGAPGSSDGSQFNGDPNADSDGNGINDFLQYALAPAGVAPILPSMGIQHFDLGEGNEGDFMTFSYTRNRIADDVAYTVQESTNLLDWTPGTGDTMELLGRVENPDGTETINFRIVEAVTDAEELYLRLSVEK